MTYMMKKITSLSLVVLLSLFTVNLAKAQQADLSFLRKELHDPGLSVRQRIAAAELLAKLVDEHPTIVNDLCKEAGLRSEDPATSADTRNPDTGDIYPISKILAQMGPSAFPLILEAWVNEPFLGARTVLSLPLLSIMAKYPSTKPMWLERYAAETDDTKRENLRRFGKDILLIKEFPAPKATADAPKSEAARSETLNVPVQEQQSSVNSPLLPTASSAQPIAISKEPTSSTSWSVIVVLIVAAGGLLWLLLKRRS